MSSSSATSRSSDRSPTSAASSTSASSASASLRRTGAEKRKRRPASARSVRKSSTEHTGSPCPSLSLAAAKSSVKSSARSESMSLFTLVFGSSNLSGANACASPVTSVISQLHRSMNMRNWMLGFCCGTAKYVRSSGSMPRARRKCSS